MLAAFCRMFGSEPVPVLLAPSGNPASNPPPDHLCVSNPMNDPRLSARMPISIGILTLASLFSTAADAGVVASYSFDDPAAIGRDSSGNQLDANVVAAATVPGRTGGAIRVDGRGGIEVPLRVAFPPRGGLAVSCWVKPAEGSENRGLISQQESFMLRLDPPGEGNQLSFFVNAGGQLEPRVRGGVLKPGAWHFVAASWDGSQARLWIDGELHKVQRTGELKPSTQPLRIGLPQVWAPVGWKGEIDEVRIYDGPLSEEEIFADLPPKLRIESLLFDTVIGRAERPCRVVGMVRNVGGPAKNLVVCLDVPAAVTIQGDAQSKIGELSYGETAQLDWQVVCGEPGSVPFTVHVAADAADAVSTTVPLDFTPPVRLPAADYVPEPQPVTGDVLVGAHYCPLWKQGSRSSGWERIVPYPERKPLLGWYDEDDPEVTDWEIKWALEHGISYFVYCWYRHNQGHGVEMRLEHAIHDGLFRSRFGDRFKFCIMWENQSRGSAGVASESDFLDNLLPFWIDNYFKHPSYLKIDNKPLLFVYRPEYLVGDLGSVENVRAALDKARAACRRAGFDGLWILGEYRGNRPEPLELMRAEGLDHSFAYCWPVAGNPSPGEAIAAQEKAWERWRELDVLPYLLTVSMGWDSTPWHPSHSIWRLPPVDFQRLCKKARTAAARLPEDSLGRRLVLLDNWNEYGEGHYIAPHRQYGFGYLDAVRAAFTDAPERHLDAVPEDVGLGPYEKHFTAFVEVQRQCAKRITAPGGDEPGLIGWWSFDEQEDSAVTFDYSGHGRGARIEGARRIEGLKGRALECRGGCALVPAGALDQPLSAVSVECWIRTDVPGQSDKWFINSIYGDGASGFRLGFRNGHVCWAVPLSRWSHHLVADRPLPLGRWVHVVGVFDGRTMTIYLDGEPCGSLERPGPVPASSYPLALGSYATEHPAHFTGAIDEVRVYDRALPADELRKRVQSIERSPHAE